MAPAGMCSSRVYYVLYIYGYMHRFHKVRDVEFSRCIGAAIHTLHLNCARKCQRAVPIPPVLQASMCNKQVGASRFWLQSGRLGIEGDEM